MTNRKDQRNDTNDLSEAANIMRTSPDPKERSEAAKTMGQVGGAHSHKNTNAKSNRDDEEG